MVLGRATGAAVILVLGAVIRLRLLAVQLVKTAKEFPPCTRLSLVLPALCLWPIPITWTRSPHLSHCSFKAPCQ